MTTAQTTSVAGIIETGIYTPAEVGRWVGLPSATVRRWIRASQPAAPAGSAGLASFAEFAEIVLVHALLQRGVTFKAIQRAHRQAVDEFGIAHPFAWKELLADGQGVLQALSGASGNGKARPEPAGGSRSLARTIEQSFRTMDFDAESHLAMRWWPLGKSKPVSVDPAVAFGAPVIAGTRIPVRNILGALGAGETSKSVCWWYNLRPKDVAAAVLFGQRGKAA